MAQETIPVQGARRGDQLRTLLGVASILVVFALAAVMTRAFITPAHTGGSAELAFRPTKAELAQWRKDTATPFQRQEVVEKMRAAFAGVANVGVGDDTAGASGDVEVVSPSPKLTTAAEDDASSTRLVMAVGVTGDHFWVTASYGDMARGAITGAVTACVSYGLPSWLCRSPVCQGGVRHLV